MAYVDFDKIARQAEEWKDKGIQERSSLLNKAVNDAIAKCVEEGNRKLTDALRPVYDEDGDGMLRELNMDYALLYARLHGRRSYMPDQLGFMCERYLHESCNEVMFGEKKPVVLTKEPMFIVQILSEMPMQLKKSTVDSLYNRYKGNQQKLEKTPVRSDLILDRISEQADDLQLPITKLNTERNPSAGLRLFVAGRISSFFSTMKRSDWSKANRMSMGTVMQLALMMDQGLDFYVCEDYTLTAPIAYRDEEHVVTITNKDIIKLVSLYLHLSREDKIEMIADLLTIGAAVTKAASSITL